MIFAFEMKVFDMSLANENEILLCTDSKILKINKDSKVEGTKYITLPFHSISIHVTIDNKVIVGGKNNHQGRAAVTVMD